mgnify:CR=1 FL=1|jgi:toxin ParE1/3/4
MNKYKLIYTENAKDDLWDIFVYVMKESGSEDTALKLYTDITERIGILSEHPSAAPVVSDRTLKKQGYRALAIDKYLVFYIIDEESHKVAVRRISHSRRDWAVLI